MKKCNFNQTNALLIIENLILWGVVRATDAALTIISKRITMQCQFLVNRK